MRGALAGGYQHAFTQDETQSYEIFTGLRAPLMQIRYHADNLVAQDIKAEVPVRAREDLARQV
jgi:anthranilate/para-aminobenzoate synthase component II